MRLMGTPASTRHRFVEDPVRQITNTLVFIITILKTSIPSEMIFLKQSTYVVCLLLDEFLLIYLFKLLLPKVATCMP
jgi:hypothetical protein